MSAKKIQRQHRRMQCFGVIMLVVLCFGSILAVVGISNSIEKIHENIIAKTPDAILASAGVTEGQNVKLAVSYYDQKADPCVNLYDKANAEALNDRQFEWSECGYYNKNIEQGLVDYKLNSKFELVGSGGELLPNKGVQDINRWFNNVDGKSQSYSGSLMLTYRQEDTAFVFGNEKFYPLDEVAFSEGDFVNTDGHNHLFTMNFAVPFTVLASGEESLEIKADDDTFVFVGDELAIDLGGIHDAIKGELLITQDGEVYSGIQDQEPAYSGINVKKDEGAVIRIFHADRDADGSEFNIKFNKMSLNVVNTDFANADDGVQIAYDPSDPSYVAPLGESLVVHPDTTRGYLIMAMVEGMVIVVVAIFSVVLAKSLLNNKK